MGIVAIFCWFVASASAQDNDARARELYDNGAILYEEGRYEDAVVAFLEAYRLSGRPALLFNIANAQERLGRWVDAHETLQRYRVYAGAEERETLDRRIFNLERRISESTVATPVESKATTQTTSPWLQPLPLALGATGAGLLVVGGAIGGVATANRAEAAAACATDGEGLLRCPVSATSAVQADQTLSVVADVSMLLGVVGLGAGIGVVLWGEGGILVAGPGYIGVSGSF